MAVDDPRERRAHVRYPVQVTAAFRANDGTVRAMGIVEELSGGGAFLTSEAGDLRVGESGVLRLMELWQSLHTRRDTLELEAEVVHKAMAGFGLRFLGESEYLVRLLDRTFGRAG